MILTERVPVSDALILLRDIAGDSAQNAANFVRPKEEHLNQIDSPAEDNTWHDVPKIDDLKAQAKEKYQQNKPFGRDEVQDATSNAAQNADDTTNGTTVAAANLKDRAPEDQKQTVRETWDKTKGYVDKKLPKERRDQTIWRLKKMIVEIQGHQDCQ